MKERARMENPLELEIVNGAAFGQPFEVWVQGYPMGACIGTGATEKEAMQCASTHLEVSLKLIQENPHKIERL